ncbi:MAG: MBL fold metallo-hydrolase [Erysipelotrichaceae bacterium]|nr:MBL fold metallo-hydrolase [Erysipelotrichaceae bacterium]
MKLEKITDSIYLYPFEEQRDRPCLSLVRGTKLNLAIDAGHSQEHVEEFYAALRAESLPLPDLTVLTHWHWDHSFACKYLHGLSCCERRTWEKLSSIQKDVAFLDNLQKTDECVAREYRSQQICVELPQLVFGESLDIDLGGLHAHCFHVASSHTDDCLCIQIPERGILFLGDCISGAYPDWLIDPAPFVRLVKTLENTEFSIAVGSHWPPFDREELLDYLRSQL